MILLTAYAILWQSTFVIATSLIPSLSRSAKDDDWGGFWWVFVGSMGSSMFCHSERSEESCSERYRSTVMLALRSFALLRMTFVII